MPHRSTQQHHQPGPQRSAQPVFYPGNRVRLSRWAHPIPEPPGRTGIILRVMPASNGRDIAYHVQLDGDTQRNRVWLFYEAELEQEEKRS
jgi:hypothetical protein